MAQFMIRPPGMVVFQKTRDLLKRKREEAEAVISKCDTEYNTEYSEHPGDYAYWSGRRDLVDELSAKLNEWEEDLMCNAPIIEGLSGTTVFPSKRDKNH